MVVGNDTTLPGGTRHEIDLTYALDYNTTITVSGKKYAIYGDYACPDDTSVRTWFPDGEYDDISYGTRWYYQDPVYTYYFYRDVKKEATSDPSGQKDVSDVVKYVKYRAK